MVKLITKFSSLIIFVAICISLQHTFWAGNSSIATLQETRILIAEEVARNDDLATMNNILKAEVIDLRHGDEAMEERARKELGLIRDGEVFYKIIETDSATGAGG